MAHPPSPDGNKALKDALVDVHARLERIEARVARAEHLLVAELGGGDDSSNDAAIASASPEAPLMPAAYATTSASR